MANSQLLDLQVVRFEINIIIIVSTTCILVLIIFWTRQDEQDVCVLPSPFRLMRYIFSSRMVEELK